MIIGGYISGMFRGENGGRIVSHLYKGDFSKPGFPMCANGWNRKYFNEKGELVDWEYSIFRGNISDAGLCKVCWRRMMKDLPPIEKPKSKYNPRNENHFKGNY